MKKTCLILTALLLSACVAKPQLNAPASVEHNKKTYLLSTEQDLGSVVRYFYVLPNESAQSWQSAVEILLDRNEQKRTLQARIDWRKKIYANSGLKNVKLYDKNDALYSYVIYEPTAGNKSWQVNVAKGKNVPHCGFVQYQYSVKIPKKHKFTNMSNKKVINHLKKYLIDKEIKALDKADWTLGCKR